LNDCVEINSNIKKTIFSKDMIDWNLKFKFANFNIRNTWGVKNHFKINLFGLEFSTRVQSLSSPRLKTQKQLLITHFG